jgi:hypothetical protein
MTCGTRLSLCMYTHNLRVSPQFPFRSSTRPPQPPRPQCRAAPRTTAARSATAQSRSPSHTHPQASAAQLLAGRRSACTPVQPQRAHASAVVPLCSHPILAVMCSRERRPPCTAARRSSRTPGAPPSPGSTCSFVCARSSYSLQCSTDSDSMC